MFKNIILFIFICLFVSTPHIVFSEDPENQDLTLSLSELSRLAISDEMGDIAKVFVNYMTNYSNATKIKEQSGSFGKDTSNLFKALADRIERENRKLYPLYDKLN